MSEESKFKDDEIRKHVHQEQRRQKNVDAAKIQAQRDILFAARTDSPEAFQARLTSHGIDLGSEQARKVMEAYWAIRRGL